MQILERVWDATTRLATLKSMGSTDEGSQAPSYPAYWEADVILRDGATAHLRPIDPEDRALLDRFHSSQSENSIYLRFFSYKPRLSERELERFTTVDHVDRVCFILLLGGSIIGVGRYDRTSERAAEVAFMISDAHQGRGIGSILLEHLAAAARENGIEVRVGDPRENVPGQVIVLPERLEQVTGRPQDMDALRRSYVKNALKRLPATAWGEVDVAFVADETHTDQDWVRATVADLTGTTPGDDAPPGDTPTSTGDAGTPRTTSTTGSTR